MIRSVVLLLLAGLASACVSIASPNYSGPRLDATRAGVEHHWSMTVRDWDRRRGDARLWIEASGPLDERAEIEVELIVRATDQPLAPDLLRRRFNVVAPFDALAGQCSLPSENLELRLILHRVDPRVETVRLWISGRNDEALEHGVWWIRP